MAHTRLYRDGSLSLENFPPADISNHLEDPSSVIWLDLCSPTEDELFMLADEFSFHRLAVEDAVTQRQQRPKLDHYDSHLFITARSALLDQASGEIQTCEVAMFVTKQALITVRENEGFDIREVVSRWDGLKEVPVSVGFLLHGVLDYVVDTHFSVVEALDDAMESVEDMLFDEDPKDNQVHRRSFELRKSLVLLRRVTLPMREVVNSLLRRDLHVVDATMQPYFQDVYDHVLRVTEWTESLRDLVSTVLDTNLTMQGNRLNQIMKKLTSWAAVIAVPTAVTGFFGQNVPYPGYGHWSGFVFSTVIMVSISGGLVAMFHRRDWI
jgi:magnesium transporter